MKRCACILVLISLLAACAPQTAEQTFFAMDTVMSVSVWGSDDDAAAAVAEIRALEAALSVTRPDSEIAALNRDGTAALTLETAGLLRQALALGALTHGAMDVTIGSVAALWGFSTGDYRLPDASDIADGS